MIPSATMVPVFHRGSVHDESTALVVFVGVTTLGPPIHWIIFFVVDVIGLEPLINLLDRFTIGFLSLGLLFGFLFFGNPFGRQCFLAEGSLLSSLSFF